VFTETKLIPGASHNVRPDKVGRLVMFYLRFVGDNGDEVNIACVKYFVYRTYDDKNEKTSYIDVHVMMNQGSNRHYEDNIRVGYLDTTGIDYEYCSFFVMNESGHTIDKIIFVRHPEE